ncbi:MAG: hypothetical protein QF637_08160 [Acidimicrobiales bacterium]|nr:hypothetical protein [Acidimicrobiales bacterium]
MKLAVNAGRQVSRAFFALPEIDAGSAAPGEKIRFMATRAWGGTFGMTSLMA